MDLIRTLDPDVEDGAGTSSSEDEDEAPLPQAKKQKTSLQKPAHHHFDASFQFGGVGGADGTAWNEQDDLSKYLKKKRQSQRTTLDDKIAQRRKERKKQKEENKEESEEEEEEEHSSEEELSEDELVGDVLNVRKREEKRLKRRQKDGDDDGPKVRVEEEEEEEDDDHDTFFETADLQGSTDAVQFDSMNLSRPLLKAVRDLNFTHTTPIQSACIPVALSGRDICGCAATGTGKTAAYMLPILERLLYRPKGVAVTRVLVLVPTRELGVQVHQVTRQLSRHAGGVEVGLSVGGLDLRVQEAELRKRPDVVIATPGRLIDHLQNTPSFTLESIEVLVLDEADRMLDECFLDQMKQIIKTCAPTRQTLLFSATMTDRVQDLAAVSLKKPVKIFVDSNRGVAWNLRQEFVRVRSGKEGRREALLAALVCRTFRDHVIVFIRTKKECHRLHILLGLLGVRVAELHGNMSQTLRLQSLRQFKEEDVDVLLTTDVAARGLDISGVKTVINYQLPNTVEQYIHRVGRTARAGRAGRSISLADEDHRKMMREIIKNARVPCKNRVVPQPIVDKYVAKVADLEDEVKKVAEEEEAEREIAKLENRANQMENALKNGTAGKKEPERVWYKDQEKKEKEREKKEIKKRKLKQRDATLDEDGKKLQREADFTARSAKRAKRPKRIRAIHDPAVKQKQGGKGGAGGKARSAFDDNIANVKTKNVKRLRHQATSEKNQQKRNKKRK